MLDEELFEDIFIEAAEENLSEKDYYRLKAKLQELEKRRKSKSTYILFLLFFITFVVSMYLLMSDSFFFEFTISGLMISIVLGALIGCIFAIINNLLFEMSESSIRMRILEHESINAQSAIEEDIFENSIKMSYKYLDQYYLQTREHAQRGFFVTVCVAVLGAVLIFIGIIAMFFEKIEPSYITCASGIITEFIAAIFFYLYNKTISSMSKYHNKLVLSQNISIALKVADSLPTEDKIKTKSIIITELLKDINIYLVKNDSSTEANE